MSDTPSIGVIGTGVLGSALAKRFRAAGYRVVAGSSDGRTGSLYPEAGQCDVVALAVPWPHGLSAVVSSRPRRGAIVLDCTNPETGDGRALEIGHSTSGAEQIARLLPGVRIVKAFNALYAEIIAGDFDFEAVPSVFFCGDDDEARETIATLIRRCGFDPIDSGPLINARYLEPLALLTVQLVRVQGWGPTGMAFRVARAIQEERT